MIEGMDLRVKQLALDLLRRNGVGAAAPEVLEALIEILAAGGYVKVSQDGGGRLILEQIVRPQDV